MEGACCGFAEVLSFTEEARAGEVEGREAFIKLGFGLGLGLGFFDVEKFHPSPSPYPSPILSS